MTQVQLRQTYSEKVYNYRPSWILRWGVTGFFLFLLIIIITSGFIKYPDIVPATVEITTINPPSHRVANINGKIEKIFVSEGQKVNKNDVLVLFESSTNLDDVKKTGKYLIIMDSILSRKEFNNIPDPDYFEKKLELGDIQLNYSDFLMSYNDLYQFFKLGFFNEENSEFVKKLQSQKEYLNQLQQKRSLLDEQFEIGIRKYLRDSSMYLKGGISLSELEASRQIILQLKAIKVDQNMNILNCRAAIVQLEYDIRKLILKNEIDNQQLIAKMQRSVQLLHVKIDSWKQYYLIDAPVNGVACFTSFWSPNQNVKVGEVVVSVVPEDSVQTKVRLQFPIQNSGKVKKGQRVNIKLQNFPYNEFGMLVGRMEEISSVPNDLMYSADVVLENGLVSSYGKKLPQTQQLIGNAEILTDEVSLLLRFFNPLKAVFDERLQKSEKNNNLAKTNASTK